MADLQRHRVDIERAIADGMAGRDELFNCLMTMPPDERAKVSPKLFARLNENQLRTLLGGERETRAAAPVDPLPPPDQKVGWRWLQNGPLPPLRTALAGALAVAVLGGGAAFAAMTTSPLAPPAVVRSIHAENWPDCPRLRRDIDGCIYTVESGISLGAAASDLAMPLATLLAVNPSIPTPTTILPTGTRLIVWRGQGILIK